MCFLFIFSYLRHISYPFLKSIHIVCMEIVLSAKVGVQAIINTIEYAGIEILIKNNVLRILQCPIRTLYFWQPLPDTLHFCHHGG